MPFGACTSGSTARRSGVTRPGSGSGAGTSTRRSGCHRDDLREAVRVEGAPAVALVGAHEEATVTQRCDEAVASRGERIRHRLERPWEAQIELLPRALSP